MRARLPRWAATLAAAGVLAAFPGPALLSAQEDRSFLEAYKTGVEAAEDEDWARAERLMREAIAGRSQEAERLLRHLHLRPYIPHFYLALALAEQGRCEEALERFAESERQGVVSGLAAETAVLRARAAACQEWLLAEAEAREHRQAVEALVARAEESAASADQLARDPALAPDWEKGEPSLAARLAEARETLDRARERLAGGADPAAAADLARGALGQIEALRREAELRRQALADERETVGGRVAALVRAGRELMESTRELVREVPSLAPRRSLLGDAVERASGAGADLPLTDLRALASLLERRISELRAAAAPPPETLQAAAEAWFRGEARAVLDALAGDDGDDGAPPFRDPRARAHALLLRAAAAFALHESESDPEGALLEAARRDAAACRGLDPELAPLPGAFSPRFRAFFAATGPDAATSAP